MDAGALIYDVGLHDGADTAYYLQLRHRVIAIDANPEACSLAEQRFAREVSEGRLRVINVGIASQEGSETFWVCDDHRDWSSFDRAIASRNGSAHHAIEVKTRPFADIVRDEGIPWYCKIDIEGRDMLCLEGLMPETAPPFLSIEMTHRDYWDALTGLGYTRFKIIDQQGFIPVSWQIYRFILGSSSVSGLTRRLNQKFQRHDTDRDWRFPFGSSGPISPHTRGTWLALADARDLWSRIQAAQPELGVWFDIHAAKPTEV